MGHLVLSSPLAEGSPFSSSEYAEVWRDAEKKNLILLNRIQPSKHSEECRRAVIDYVTSLLETEIGCKVFSFGSVPLKTYLPDGDIDLTAIGSSPQFDKKHHAWAESVCKVLEREERIHVKEVKCIHAEVPVVKCLVGNIIVDITFNQLGGLSTLCFLEEVDKRIGQDHLFKKSIILVKSWCFYESRILGAHYGLLSTYALEVLVLYIFQVYHQSLRGPVEVLYRFLWFFSKFNWEQFCLSPWGPVPLGLPQDFGEVLPPSCDGNFLLSDKFLRSCREKYGTQSENRQGKTFSRKYMNLVDPLRPFNNLGRSVNSGNLVRMYSAFTYGAARMEKLLQSPNKLTCESLAQFFRNTQRHCEGHRPDAGRLSFRVYALCNGSHVVTSNAMETSQGINNMAQSYCLNANGAHGDKAASDDLSCASLQLDDPKQSSSDASSAETVVYNHKASCQERLSDEREDNSLRSDVCLIDNYLVDIQVSNDFSVAHSSDRMPGQRGPCMVSEDHRIDTDSQKRTSSSTSTPKVTSTSDCLNANGAHYDKASSDDFSCASLQLNGPEQSSSDACSDDTVVYNHKASSQDRLPDGRVEDSLRSNVCSDDNYLVNIKVSNDCSELRSSDRMPGQKGSCMVSEEYKVDTDSQKSTSSSTSTPKVTSTSSETASISSTEELFFDEQAVSVEGDTRGHRQFECRDTDADILMGNLEQYSANLNSGWAYQNKVTYGNPCILSGAFTWGGPGTSFYLHSSRGNNDGGVPSLANGAILGRLLKSHRGTGTFLPNLNLNLERDKRVYSSGVRSSRKNIDSFNSTNHSAASTLKSRSNVPKRRDGQNKARSKKISDFKAAENKELATEPTVIGNEQSPSVNIGEEFTVSSDRHMDRGRDMQKLITRDLPWRSVEADTVPASCRSGKGIAIENLEFGSFGPRFLTTGLHHFSEPKEHSEHASQAQCFPPGDGLLESMDRSKAGPHSEQQRSIYYLKEEDFPPLT